MSGFRPDIIVGIDFGMYTTSVAWTMGPEWPEPRTIQQWPGKLDFELKNSVSSSVSYNIRTGNLTAWGSLCDPDNEEEEYNALFKFNLDPEYEDAIEGAPTYQEARIWYGDYLACLYKHIMKFFSDIMPRFAKKRIDFIFSVPATWRDNPAMLVEIEQIIHHAGYGQNDQQRAHVYLCEPEALVAYNFQTPLMKGELVLVCDTGNGTTDIGVWESDISTSEYGLKPLIYNEGVSVGSTLIDWKIRTLVKERLLAIRYHIDGNVDSLVSRMMEYKFDSFKCSFGWPSFDVPGLFLPIPGLPPGLDYPHAAIEDSKMFITRDELRIAFDDQVGKLFQLIDKQLFFVKERKLDAVRSIVLSGELGTQAYVQSQIRNRYEAGATPLGERIRVVVASEPTLAVAHGLIMARLLNIAYTIDERRLDEMANIARHAKTLHEEGRWDEAENWAREVLTKAEKVLRPQDVRTLNAAYNLGLVLADKGKTEAAEQMYQRAFAGWQELSQPDDQPTSTISFLKNGHTANGQVVELDKIQKQALPVLVYT